MLRRGGSGPRAICSVHDTPPRHRARRLACSLALAKYSTIAAAVRRVAAARAPHATRHTHTAHRTPHDARRPLRAMG
eukprot:7280772-Prymnesium_polylepis.2